MSDLTEFLLARIAEDEAAARDAEWAEQDDAWGYVPEIADEAELLINRYPPARVLAECKAKRAAVEDFGPVVGDGDGYAAAAEHALHYMASAYADHPDYREEWRP